MLRELTILGLLLPTLTACGSADREAPPDPSATVTASAVKRPSIAFTPTTETIHGDWYVVATNPNPKYHNKIAIDYLRFSFREGGLVTKTSNAGGDSIESELGTYLLDPSDGLFKITFDLGKHGIQVTSWKQVSPSQARATYWKNLTLGHEHKEDDKFVKQGTEEWNKRGKVSLNDGRPLSDIDPQDLKIGATYELSAKTPLMPNLDPVDPIAALARVESLPAGTAVKITSVVTKVSTPWYEVRVPATDQRGWINSKALLGQSLKLQE